MRKREFQKTKEELVAEYQEEMHRNTVKTRFLKRVIAVNMYLNGMKGSEVCKVNGISHVAFSKWLDIVEAHGIEGLADKKHKGRSPRLSAEQLADVKSAAEKIPSESGFNVWNGPSLSDFIQNKFGVFLYVRRCQYMLHEMGFSLVRPQTFPSLGEQKDKERESFKKNIDRWRANKNIEIFYQDEVHFFAESTITRGWYPKGSEPKVKSYASHKSVAYSGFVNSRNGKLFVTKPSWFTFETVIESIREFINSIRSLVKKGKKIILVMDNAPWHKKAKRLIQEDGLEEYADIRSALTIISLPPYFPDLNPIEQVWRITRRKKTHNHFWKTIDTLITVLDAWFSGFAKANKKLAGLCSFKTKPF